jgi:hypothetical protein
VTYEEKPDAVVLTMSKDDFDRLLLMLGFAAGAAKAQGDNVRFYSWIEFVNELNRTNPRFIPYQIPEKFRSALSSAGREDD